MPDQLNVLPGDVPQLSSIGMGEGLPIWERMAVIIRIRRFNVRDLMAGFDKNNFGIIDLPTFQRALCNAFSNQWIELAMTTAEFREITEPYITRRPLRSGEPGSFVQWSQFSNDLQLLADTKKPSQDFLNRLSKVEAREKASQELMKNYGVTEDELKLAFQYFLEKVNLMSKKGLNDGFRRMDQGSNGCLSGQELLDFFMTGDKVPWYINEKTIGVLVDWSDVNEDDQIDYIELSDAILCTDLLEFAANVPKKRAAAKSKGHATRPIGKRGVGMGQVIHLQKELKKKLGGLGGGGDNAYNAIASYLDKDGSGTVSRDEIKMMCLQLEILKHKSKKTGMIKGDCEDTWLLTLLDIVDHIAQTKGKSTSVASGHVDIESFVQGIMSMNIIQHAGIA